MKAWLKARVTGAGVCALEVAVSFLVASGLHWLGVFPEIPTWGLALFFYVSVHR